MEEARRIVATQTRGVVDPITRQCPDCKKWFASSSGLAYHLRTHCGKAPAPPPPPPPPPKNARRVPFCDRPLPEGVEMRGITDLEGYYGVADEKFLEGCIKMKWGGLLRLIRKIYFNTDHPENMVYDWRNVSVCEIYRYESKRRGWQSRTPTARIEEMLSDVTDIMNEFMETHKDTTIEGGHIARQAMMRWVQTMDKQMTDRKFVAKIRAEWKKNWRM
jgi:hypothetical protein